MTDVRDLIEGAAGAGWEWFDKAKTLFGDRSKLVPTDEAKRRALAEAAARIFSSEDGRLVLAHLKAATVDRPSFVTQLGVDPMQVYGWGSFREGQNTLFVAIAKLILEGRPGEGGDVTRRSE